MTNNNINIDVHKQGVYHWNKPQHNLIFHINRCEYTPNEYFAKIHGLNSVSSNNNGYIVYDNGEFYSIDEAECQQPVPVSNFRDCKLYVLTHIQSGEMQCDSCGKYEQNENLHVVKGDVMCIECFKKLWKTPL